MSEGGGRRADEPPVRAGDDLVESDADADPTDGRRETVNQRMDRNWVELLHRRG